MKRCPFCAEEIQDEAIVCRYCGRDLPRSAEEPSPVPALDQAEPTSPAPSPALKKRMSRPVVLAGFGALLIVMLVLGSLFNSSTKLGSSACEAGRVRAAATELNKIVTQWRDVEQVAASTGRIALSGPVQEMQAIRRSVDEVEVPACLASAKGYLAQSMSYAIEGYIAFMGEKSDATVQNSFSNADTELTQYGSELERITACMPNCK